MQDTISGINRIGPDAVWRLGQVIKEPAVDVEIFKSLNEKDTYAVVEKGTSATKLPEGNWKPFKETTLSPSDKRIGIDSTQAIEDIQADGHHIAKAKIVFSQT